MFRFIITLVLINTSYHSLGMSIAPFSPLGKPLKALADRCEDQFIVSQIKDHIPECNISEFDAKQMRCLIFYDISIQLCDAAAKYKSMLQNGSINDLKKTVKVDSMCENAQFWKFTDLSDFPLYKTYAKTIFKNELQCRKVCDVPDLISEDSNIFCKYYNWGSEILKFKISNPAVLEKSTDNKIIVALSDQPVSADVKAPGIFSSIITGVSTVKSDTIKSDNTLLNNYQVSVTDTTLTNVEKPEEGPGARVVQTSSFNTAISGAEIKPDNPKDTKQQVTELSPNEISNNVGQLAVVPKPDVKEEQPPKRVDIDKEDQILNSQNKDMKDQVVDDLGDDPDTEEDEKQDLADDSEISIGKGDVQKIEEKGDENVESKNIPIKTTFTAEKSQEEFIPKIPQEDFPEDDDHFFSFFLTAVIIVVLLYVLYHNKSKFTKVILGLIVEGRQPGRRRNSRGHAYRRLDTLEQAMSSNTPAPPSKIIY